MSDPCGALRGADCMCGWARERLRDWLDREPPRNALDFHIGSWRDWFDTDGNYLGQRSARTGPDVVGAPQRCGCGQCSGSVVLSPVTGEP